MMKQLLLTALAGMALMVGVAAELPQPVRGTWLNENTNDWTYGFFKDFAMYDGGFWSYALAHTKRKRTEVVLTQGIKKVALTITEVSKNQLKVSVDKGTAVLYKRSQVGFNPYPMPDHTVFQGGGYSMPDTVTITGFFEHFEVFPTGGENPQNGPFTVGVPDLMTDNNKLKYYGDVDSLGRFTVKFPLSATQEVYLDWGRLMVRVVATPGEHIMVYADATYHLFQEMTMAGYTDFAMRKKHILFMGENARLHNEVAAYPPTMVLFNRQEESEKAATDLAFIARMEAFHQQGLDHLNKYIAQYPTLSNRFKQMQRISEVYRMARSLGQHRFKNSQDGRSVLLDSGYMEYIEANIPVYGQDSVRFLTSDYIAFLKDYLWYYVDIDHKRRYPDGKISVVSHNDIVIEMADQGMLSETEYAAVKRFQDIVEQLSLLTEAKDSLLRRPLEKEIQALNEVFSQIQQRPEMQKAIQIHFQNEWMESEIAMIDQHIPTDLLQQLLIARNLYRILEQTRAPLSGKPLAIVQERITHPAVRDALMSVSRHYEDIGKQQISYSASLVNTDHLREATDADSIFQELIAPYRGKVIYLDVWGTWCGPCRQQMQFVPPLKEAFAGQEVVFMYLANRSPQKAWENIIKDMHLTGKSVVHYNLPNAQQAMLERKLNITAFPSYFLIDKHGNIANWEAPRPEQYYDAVQAIQALLQ